ncbi:MAG TPA: DEAD/DEAH box helicase, partial [Candidatus Thermoplasmatota archaeon]|nr:DEAD/DEAH box helicase [Candidatus Thermoplasmatota archaeon]
PPEIRRLAERYLRTPEFVRAESEEEVVSTRLTEQYALEVRGDKLPTLLGVFEQEKPTKSIIFTRTKHGAKRLAKKLNAVGFKADALQGNLSQNARDRVMAQFRDGQLDHLVATDVAARGLDVKGISHVVNFDFPMVNEDYVHRIGRTGRNGERGRAFLFVEPGEERDAKAVERIAGVPIELYDVGRIPQVPQAAAQHVDQGPPGGGGRGGGYRNGGGHSRGYGGGGQRSGGGGRSAGGRSGGGNGGGGARRSSYGQRRY